MCKSDSILIPFHSRNCRIVWVIKEKPCLTPWLILCFSGNWFFNFYFVSRVNFYCTFSTKLGIFLLCNISNDLSLLTLPKSLTSSRNAKWVSKLISLIISISNFIIYNGLQQDLFLSEIILAIQMDRFRSCCKFFI